MGDMVINMNKYKYEITLIQDHYKFLLHFGYSLEELDIKNVSR